MRVSLSVQPVGNDLIVRLFNGQEHIGAVAVSEYNPYEDRASTSVITRFGHKDDSIAYTAAYKICRLTKKPVCAIAGIHLDRITANEIEQITKNCSTLVDRYLNTGVRRQEPGASKK